MIMFSTIPTMHGEIIINNDRIILEKKIISDDNIQYSIIINPRDSRVITKQTYLKLKSDLVSVKTAADITSKVIPTKVRKPLIRQRSK